MATAIGLAVSHQVRAQPAPPSIALWPALPPGGPGPTAPERASPKASITKIAQPRLTLYRPTRSNGTAMLVIAGGGYAHIEAGSESTPACQWLQSLGVTAFELIYRLPEDWSPAAPFQDGQRAMRLIRAGAASFGIDPARIGIMGFSAGGHLAGTMAVQPAAQRYTPVDAADALSARPDFAALLYPVLSMMPPLDHTHARREILGQHPSEAESSAASVERHVTAGTPPTFLAQAVDDPISPVDNSLMMFAALRAAGVPAEMHLFQSGRHGWGMGKPGSEPAAWPGLFATWAAANGFLKPI